MSNPTQASRRETDPKGNGATLVDDDDSTPLPPPSHTSPPVPKQIGKYKIEKLLGSGAMGEVYLAQDEQLNRSVALKVPNFDKGQPSNPIKRFMREAQAAANLTHPNICPVYEFGEADGFHFISMGYIEGRPLSDYIASGKTFPERQVSLIIRKVALALQEAHDRGVIHRDLKPANIMINGRNEPIVMDFGLAQLVDDETVSRLTKEGMVVGTPAYMSPEQIKGNRKLTRQTDIYSLGVVLYEFLAGKIPFSGNFVSVISQVLHAKAKPIEELRPDISPTLAAICRKAMEKNPDERYASMKAFAGDLSNFLKGKSTDNIAAAATMVEEPVSTATFDDDFPDPFADPPPARAAALPTIAHSAQQTQSREITVSLTPTTLLIGAAVLLLLAFGTAWALIGGNGDSGSGTDGANAIAVAGDNQGNVSNESGSSATETDAGSSVIDDSATRPRLNGGKPKGLLARAQALADKNELENGSPATEKPADETKLASADTTLPTPEPGPGTPGGDPAEKPPAGPDSSLPPIGPRPSPSGNEKKASGPEQRDFPPARPPQLLQPGSTDSNFDALDRNNDKVLDQGELALHVILRIDTDNDLQVSYKELEAAGKKINGDLREFGRLNGPPEFKELFEKFDRNNDRAIDADEMARLLNISPEDAEADFVSPADADGDGKVSFSEMKDEWDDKGPASFGMPAPPEGERPGPPGGGRPPFRPPGGRKNDRPFRQ